MNALIIETPRLELIAASCEMGESELSNREKFSSLLSAEIPENWPPPDNDETTMKWFLERLKENPANHDWLAWYIILKNDSQGKRIAIGGCGFKGAPDKDGTIETGYSILVKYQRQGFASKALKGLLAWAFSHVEVKRVIAETLDGHVASVGVMLKNGLRFTGLGSEVGTIRYEITKEDSLSTLPIVSLPSIR